MTRIVHQQNMEQQQQPFLSEVNPANTEESDSQMTEANEQDTQEMAEDQQSEQRQHGAPNPAEERDEEMAENAEEMKEGLQFVKKFDENTETWRWVIPNISQLKNKKYSETFTVGNEPWRILIFPQGNQVPYVSLYVDVADAKTLPYGWTKYARFGLTIVNQKDPKKNVEQEAEKRFNWQENDWGFREFMPLSTLYNLEEGYIVNDTLVVEATVNVCNEPYLTNPYNYDSKKTTGFVGLKNQGATCYLNSLLQTLYHVSYFRKAVYNMPTENDESPLKSIPLALQRVFWRLQYSDSCVDTKELTKSFGWDTIDSFMQHDVQELARVLMDNLEEKMKKTAVEGTMSKLFEGKIKNYIKCVNIDFQSVRSESFYDIQLNVKGCNNVMDSFEKYVEVEMLEGDNKYMAEGHGLQDAKKGCIFESFPPVLMLHLKRFEYDFQRDCMYKVNDRYEFEDEIDLSKYCEGPEGTTRPPGQIVFSLYSVLVHSGDVSGGHYYAFIRPYANDPQWYKFDDERVYKVTAKEAMEDNFGGDETRSNIFPHKKTHIPYKRFSNAYMLVYIRKDRAQEILKPVSDEEVPAHLRERFDREREIEERRKKEKAEAHKYVHIKVATNEDLKKHEGTDLVNFDLIEPIRIKKSAPLTELKRIMEERHGVPAQCQRYWKWEQRQNRTHRPDSVIAPSQEQLPLEKIFQLSAHQADNLNLFLEESRAGDNEEPFQPLGKDDILLFFKFYDPEAKKLEYIGCAVCSGNDTLPDLVPIMNSMKGFSENGELLAYEEVRPSMIEPVDPNITLKRAELQHGDILTFQRPLPDNHNYEYPKVPDYYQYLLYRRTIKFIRLGSPAQQQQQQPLIQTTEQPSSNNNNDTANSGDTNGNNNNNNTNMDSFTMELLKNMTYEQVTQKLAAVLGTEPQFIRLTGHNPYQEQPKATPFKTTEVKTLKDMLVTGQTTSEILYYEILDIPITELENKKSLQISFYNLKGEEVEKLNLLLNRDSSVADALNMIRERVPIDERGGDLRLMEVYQHKISKIYPLDEKIEMLHSYNQATLRVEQEHPEEVARKRAGEKVTYVQAQHFCKEHGTGANATYRTFGAPIILTLKKDEKVADIKERIKRRLELDDDEFAKWKFAVFRLNRPEYFEDDDDLVLDAISKAQKFRAEVVIGMEHKDTTPRVTVKHWYDKAIKING